MVSVGGYRYSVPDATRKRVVEVHTLGVSVFNYLQPNATVRIASAWTYLATAVATTISNGGILGVSPGGSASGTTISNAGLLVVLSGGMRTA